MLTKIKVRQLLKSREYKNMHDYIAHLPRVRQLLKSREYKNRCRRQALESRVRQLLKSREYKNWLDVKAIPKELDSYLNLESTKTLQLTDFNIR